MADIDKELMDALYERQKRLIEPFQWIQNEEAPHRYSAQCQAKAVDGDELLTVRGEYWVKRFSFTLSYRNTGICRWDFSGHHEGISDGHKHFYPFDSGGTDRLLSVDDVTTSDVNQALLDFLDECKIQHDPVTIDKITGLNHYE